MPIIIDLVAKIKLDASRKNCPPAHSQLPYARVNKSELGLPCCPECKEWDLRFFQSSQTKTARLVRNPEIRKDNKISVICVPCKVSFMYNYLTGENTIYLDSTIFCANEKNLEEEIGYERD
jgi:hypothetical protein